MTLVITVSVLRDPSTDPFFTVRITSWRRLSVSEWQTERVISILSPAGSKYDEPATRQTVSLCPCIVFHRHWNMTNFSKMVFLFTCVKSCHCMIVRSSRPHCAHVCSFQSWIIIIKVKRATILPSTALQLCGQLCRTTLWKHWHVSWM